MPELERCLENWLIAERQQMARSISPSKFLSDRDRMREASARHPDDPLNTGVAKSRSHAMQCEGVLARVDQVSEPVDVAKHYGTFAAKALKVATGFAMRASYFHPLTQTYRQRTVMLRNRDGLRLPALAESLPSLFDSADIPSDADELVAAARSAAEAVEQANQGIYAVVQECDSSPSWEVYTEVLRVGADVRRQYVGMAVGAIALQDNGFDGLGALILEPRSDAEAVHFLRAHEVELVGDEGAYSAFSPNTVAR